MQFVPPCAPLPKKGVVNPDAENQKSPSSSETFTEVQLQQEQSRNQLLFQSLRLKQMPERYCKIQTKYKQSLVKIFSCVMIFCLSEFNKKSPGD